MSAPTDLHVDEATSAALVAQAIAELVPDGTCSSCGRPAVRVARHDAVACLECDVWLEGLCGEPGCAYCLDRPATPRPTS